MKKIRDFLSRFEIFLNKGLCDFIVKFIKKIIMIICLVRKYVLVNNGI